MNFECFYFIKSDCMFLCASLSVSVYLVASRQTAPLRTSRSVCRLLPSRDHSDSRRPTLLQTPGQRSADTTRQGDVMLSRCSAELQNARPLTPPRVGLSPAAAASPAALCTICPSPQDSFSAPLLSSQSQFLWGPKQETLSAPVFSLVSSSFPVSKVKSLV